MKKAKGFKVLNKYILVLIIGLVVLLILVGSFFVYQNFYNAHKNDKQNNNTNDSANNNDKKTDNTLATAEGFTLTGSYADGFWDYSLKGTAPTPCYTVVASYATLETFPEQINMTVVVTAPIAGTVCVQTIQNFSETGEITASAEAKFVLSVKHEQKVVAVDKITKEKLSFNFFDDPTQRYTISFNYNPSHIQLEADSNSNHLITLSYGKKGYMSIWTWIEGDTSPESLAMSKVVYIGKVGVENIYRPSVTEIKQEEFGFDYKARLKDADCKGDYLGIKLTPPCFYNNTIYPNLITRVIVQLDNKISSKDLATVLAEFDKLVASIDITKVK